MPSIVLKLQSCGKENCSCRREGRLHGPYFWLVSYKKDDRSVSNMRKTKGRRGRYVWKYLGKQVDQVVKMIVSSTELAGTLGRKSLQLIEREIENKVNEFFDDPERISADGKKKTKTYPLIEDLDQWLGATVTSATS